MQEEAAAAFKGNRLGPPQKTKKDKKALTSGIGLCLGLSAIPSARFGFGSDCEARDASKKAGPPFAGLIRAR